MSIDRSHDPVWVQRRIYVALNALAHAPVSVLSHGEDSPEREAFDADVRSATRALLGTTDLRTCRGLQPNWRHAGVV
jgi:hypothetical protein